MRKKINLFIVIIVGILLVNTNFKVYAENNLSSQFQLKWAKKYTATGEQTSAQTIIDGNLIFTVGNNLYKVNKDTGEIIKKVKLKGQASYNSPTVGDGKVFVAINDGIIQAFDLNSFENIWTYKDEYAGDAICKIIYNEKKIYTGIYNDNGQGKYICLSTEAEKNKKSLWNKEIISDYRNVKGKIVDSTIIIGGKDKSIYFLDINNGNIKNQIKLKGNISSSIIYTDGKLYFCTSNGYIYSANFDGNSKLDNLKFQNYELGKGYTPIVHKDRIYIPFASDSGGRIVVADKNNLKTKYIIKLNGLPNDNMILKQGKNMNLYIYTTYKDFPGNAVVIKINAYEKKSDKAEIKYLLQLKDEYKDYCNVNLVEDNQGNMYYSNNSAYIMNLYRVEDILSEDNQKNENEDSNSSSDSNNKNHQSDNSQSKDKIDKEAEKKRREEELKREEANKKAGMLIIAAMAFTFGIGTLKFLYGK